MAKTRSLSLENAGQCVRQSKEPIQTSKPYKQTEKPTNSAETPILENPTEQNENIAIASHETEDISGQIPEVANCETEPSVYARRTVKFPSSCVIKTDNPDELISSIDIDITNEAYGFSIKAEDWELFENYIAESGAEYEVEYSEDIVYNIDIEIENSQTLEKEDIEKRISDLKINMIEQEARMALGFVWEDNYSGDYDAMLAKADNIMYEDKRSYYEMLAKGSAVK